MTSSWPDRDLFVGRGYPGRAGAARADIVAETRITKRTAAQHNVRPSSRPSPVLVSRLAARRHFHVTGFARKIIRACATFRLARIVDLPLPGLGGSRAAYAESR
mgnify:CR=1 FL=1